MKAFLLDAEKREKHVVEIADNDHLSDFYKYLNCTTIDITTRKIDGRLYDIIVDDEGFFSEHPIVSALDSDGQPALVGNLLFCNFDDATGEELSLTDDDVAHLDRNTAAAMYYNEEKNEYGSLLVMTKVDADV